MKEGDETQPAETRFETVQEHPVKSVYRYYDGEGRLVHESDSSGDLDVSISFDRDGRLSSKRGFAGEKTFWEDRYLYDEEGRLSVVLQSDLNRELYERGEYAYEPGRITFTKYILEKPVFSSKIIPGTLGHACLPEYQRV